MIQNYCIIYCFIFYKKLQKIILIKQLNLKFFRILYIDKELFNFLKNKNMKKYILLIYLFFSSMFVFSQDISNSNFEKWKNSIPENWKTSNSEQIYLYYDENNNKTLAIESNNKNPEVSFFINDADIEINQSLCLDNCEARPIAFIFDYMFEGEEFSVEIVLKNGREIVGKGSLISSNNNDIFQPKEVEIEYFNQMIPDKVDINFTVYSSENSDSKSLLILDNLSYKKQNLSSSVQEKTSISIFPNPAKDFLDIKLNLEKSQAVKITLYNIIGTIVYENQQVEERLHDFRINLSKFRKGIYFVNFSIGKKTIVKKIVKQ